MASTTSTGLGNVLILEDERFTRTMLEAALTGCGLEVVGSFATAPGALLLADRVPIDVALLDLDLGPGPSGIDVAHALRARQERIGVVFLTSFSDPRIKDPRERHLPRGSRFMVKNQLDDVTALRDAIVSARREPLALVDPDLTQDELTGHQLSVLRQVAAGRTNAQIATYSGTTEKAVERTVQRILDALAIDREAGNQRVQLTRAYALMSGKRLPGE